MKEIKLYNSVGKPLLRVFCLGSLVIVLYYLHITMAANWPLFVGGILFGIPMLTNLFYVLDRRPHIILTGEGIYDNAVHDGIISWQVIKEAYPVAVYGRRFICIAVDDGFKPDGSDGNIYKRLALFSKSLGAKEFHLSLRKINVDEEKLAAFIVKMKAANEIERSRLLNAGITS